MEEGEIMDIKETIDYESGSERYTNRRDDVEEKSQILSLADIRNEFGKIPTQLEVCRMGAEDLRRWVMKLLKLNKATSRACRNGEAKLKTLRAVLDEEAKRIRECDRQLREHGLAMGEVALPHQTPTEMSCPVLENNFSSLSIAPKLRTPMGGTNGSRIESKEQELCDVATSVAPTAGFEGCLPPQSFNIPPPILSVPPPHFSVPPPNLNIPPPFLNVPTSNVAVPPPNFAAPPPGFAIPPANMNAPPPAQSTSNTSSLLWDSNFI